jgi:hypothetical protein
MLKNGVLTRISGPTREKVTMLENAAKYYSGGEIKKDKMSRECSTHSRHCTHNFDWTT